MKMINNKIPKDILTEVAEPSGLLPMQMPEDMKTVEVQFEDVPRAVEVYVDSEGIPLCFNRPLTCFFEVYIFKLESYTS